MDGLPRVVIVGGGFGGLWAARALRTAPCHVVLIDRENHHVFQPLLYQVATAGLSPADIAQPIRGILRGQRNLEVLMAEVIGVDPEAREVLLSDRRLPFDFLVIASGARHSYFGHDEWERHAAGLKTLQDATRIRSRILTAFENAEAADSAEGRKALLTFAVIGGGPTGVELAGSLAEIAFRALARDFDHIDPRTARILLIEAGPRLLPGFPEDLAWATQASLGRMGVEVKTSTRVEGIDAAGVQTNSGRFDAGTVLWAAGIRATPAAEWLGVECDHIGRVLVNPDCSAPGYPETFVIGDAMCLAGADGGPLPGVAQVAMQQGEYVSRLIRRRIADCADSREAPAHPKQPEPPFRYKDKGIMATIGRRSAVAVVGRMKLRGFPAWLFWLGLHIWYLIGFRNKLLVLIQWAWSYLTFQRGARLIIHTDRD